MLINDDCLNYLQKIESNSIDSLVCDPPYGINLLSKNWDKDIPNIQIWSEIFRVLKPGGHGLVACGTKTQHRMATRLEDVGFEIRDIIAWVYGTGMPKGLNIPNGWNTALKPAMELFTLIRKPISEKNIAHNVIKWGTGGINIDGSDILPRLKSVGFLI